MCIRDSIYRSVSISGTGSEKEVCLISAQTSTGYEVFTYCSRLTDDNRCTITIAIKGRLQVRHRLLGGAAGEHFGLGLRCVVAGGGLLRAGGREEGSDDRGEENDDQKRQNERRCVFCIFGEITFHWDELTTTEGDEKVIVNIVSLHFKI